MFTKGMRIVKRSDWVLVIGGVLCSVLFGIAGTGSPVPVELQPISRMDARTTDKTRDPGLFGDYWWANRFLSRHRQIVSLKGGSVDVVMIGDSITHFWEWLEPEAWTRFTKDRTALNLGYGGDRTEQVIWRIEHGELDGYVAKNVVLLIGTNNDFLKNGELVLNAIEKIVGMIRTRQPTAKIILHPLFPRGHKFEWAKEPLLAFNAALRASAARNGDVTFIDFNDKLIDEDGFAKPSLFPDSLHPSDRGYDLWMSELVPVLRK